MAHPFPALQREYEQRLKRGERLLGPVRVVIFNTDSRREVERAWGWESTRRAAHAATVAALMRRGIVDIRPAPDAEREAVLKEECDG